MKSVNLVDIEKVTDISANTFQRRNLRTHSHHQLFRLDKICFLKIVQGCQISKVLASLHREVRADNLCRKPNQIYAHDVLSGVMIDVEKENMY